jgi:hypothetical protein
MCSAFLEEAKGVSTMPTSKEFAVLMEDWPGTLGKVCRALAGRGVNIFALQSFHIDLLDSLQESFEAFWVRFGIRDIRLREFPPQRCAGATGNYFTASAQFGL